MRVARLLLAFALALPVAAFATGPTANGLRMSPGEAGETFELGSELCGVQAADLSAFREKLDKVQPGMTQSPSFIAGQQRIRDAVAELRANGDDMHEFRETRCNGAVARITTTR